MSVVTRQRGYALPLALVSLVVFSILITVYFSLLTNEYRVNANLVNSWQAKYVAESGVENSIFYLKKAVDSNAYALDLTTSQFGSDGNYLLPGDTYNLAQSGVSNLKSSNGGTLRDTSGQTVGAYAWAIIYQGTQPPTPATTNGTATYENTLTNTLVIQSVGRLGSTGPKYRIAQKVQVTFVPLNIPESAVNVQTVSQQTVTTPFDWESYLPASW